MAVVKKALDPHERLARHGADSLSDSELLAVLLSNGHRGARVKKLAQELLGDYGGLSGLAGAKGSYQLRRGMSNGRGTVLLVAFEIALRLTRSKVPRRDPLNYPEAVAAYLSLRYSQHGQEVMGALYLDIHNRLIAETELFRGALYRMTVEPRAVLKEGLFRSAAGFVVFHTHPSGDLSPSKEDLAFTYQLAEAGELLGLKLLDHLILGSGGRWVSLKRNGFLVDLGRGFG